MENWSNLARVATMRTYSRDNERWNDIVERAIQGNIRLTDVPETEVNELRELMLNRIATPAGRGLWFSGTKAQERLGGAALNNCWFVTGDNWWHLVLACDLLMLGGGVGMSVQHKYVSKLPKVRGATIKHKNSKDAFYIVPDSREGWCELIRIVLKAYFETGRCFDYSTCCIRGKGEKINGFGGTASGPLPLIECIENICRILDARIGKHMRPVDMADLLCCIGKMVVAGNVRRSAIIIIGDPWDREYLTCKRWDLKTVPVYRQFANFSVACSDHEDLHPSFWRTYEQGEAFGFVNLDNIQRYGRMGEEKLDTAIGVNPCAEATLENGEPCNLLELFMRWMKTREQFCRAAELMYRWGKRVCLENYHHDIVNEVIHRNNRIGVGITGCLQSHLFTPEDLDAAYQAIQRMDAQYS
jgi:ribonucleoside-triphosphate reductase